MTGAARLALLAATLVLAGCDEPADPTARLVAGDAGEGRRLVQQVGCGACHRIPGIDGARGVVGPPLDGFGRRPFIAGTIANRQDILVAWITDPPSLVPATAMPAVGLTVEQATDVAAYLQTLR